MRVVTYIIAILLGSCLYAQDGSPDLSFGDDSIVLTDLGNGDEIMNDAVQLLNGTILVAGGYQDIGIDNNVLIAFTENGAIDTSFGLNGIIESPAIDFLRIKNLLLQPSGKFLAHYSGVTNIHMLERRLQNGDLDPGFANDGLLELFIESSSSSFVKLTNDGKIIAATLNNMNGTYVLVVNKFLVDGAIDTSFANNGTLEHIIISDEYFSIRDFVVYPNEDFSVLYRTDVNGPYEYYIRHFLANGDLDLSYGLNGEVLIPFEADFYSCSCLLFADSQILASCNYYDFNSDITFRAMYMFTEDGSLNNAFNGGSVEGVTGSLIQTNQRIIADKSYVDFEGGIQPIYNRYFKSGNYDSSFQFSTFLNGLGSVKLVSLQSGKLLLVADVIWYEPESLIVLQQFHNSPLGIEENQLSKVIITPNPSRGIFEITLSPLNDTVSEYRIVDLSGKLIQKGTVDSPNFSIDLSAFEAGMYFLNINHST